MRRTSVVTIPRGAGLRTIWKRLACRRRTGRGGMACRAALPRSTDARLLHDAGWRDEGLKGCAARTGQPAAALDPLTRTPRLAVMPFRTSVFAAGVSSLLCAQ